MGEVFVTGGSGVVGAAVIRHLVARGWRTRSLSRSRESDVALAAAGAEPVRGDVLQRRGLSDLMDGCETVFHVAGVNQICPADPHRMTVVNVAGSLNVLRAARIAGSRRLVYTSSAATIGERSGTVGSEHSTHRGWFLSAYERSKFLAERAVMTEAAREGGPEVVSVNPASVQGPGRASGTGKLILDLLRGRLPVLVDTRLSIVGIDDCAEGHLLAAERGRPGERYLLNSFTLPIREAVALLEETAGRRLPVTYIPGALAAAGAAALEASARAVGKAPPVCREMVRTIRHGHAYDGSKAEAELGLGYTDAPTLLGRLVEWFRSEGLWEV